MAANKNELVEMEISTAAKIRLTPSLCSKPRLRPRPARMMENSPICPRLTAIDNAVFKGYFSTSTTTSAASRLPKMAIKTTSSTLKGWSTKIFGSTSMPMDTKNSTEKASRRGRVSSAARWLYSDSRITTPATNAPSANDTPKNLDAPKAMPMAVAITARVNSSREPVLATCHKNQGSTRLPTMNISAIKAPTSSSVLPTVIHSGLSVSGATAASPSTPASGGKSTSASTVTRSCTTSQPTAMRPFMVSSWPRVSSALSSTTVLAQASDRPKIKAPPSDQFHSQPTHSPAAVVAPIWISAPGMAIFLTDHRSCGEKCRPTPNIKSMMPISDSCPAICASATKPGVAGPIKMPASK